MTNIKTVKILGKESPYYSLSNSQELKQELSSKIKNCCIEKKNFGVYGSHGITYYSSIDLSYIAFTYYNPIIKDGELFADINILNTPKGLLLKETLEVENSIYFSCVMYGAIVDNFLNPNFIFITILAE